MAIRTMLAAFSWGSFRHPPAWLLVLLWLSLAYVLFRIVAVSILRSQLVQAWILARLHAAPVTFGTLIGLVMRGHDAKKLVRCCIMVREVGVDLSLEAMVSHSTAGGDPEAVAMALVAAQHAGLEARVGEFVDADLAGKDPLAVVEERLAATKGQTPAPRVSRDD